MIVVLTDSARDTLTQVAKGKRSDPVRRKKLANTLRLLEDPHHPGLQSHRYRSLDDVFGAPIWESYVENNTPTAWRVWWFYGPDDGEITVVHIGPHPD